MRPGCDDCDAPYGNHYDSLSFQLDDADWYVLTGGQVGLMLCGNCISRRALHAFPGAFGLSVKIESIESMDADKREVLLLARRLGRSVRNEDLSSEFLEREREELEEYRRRMDQAREIVAFGDLT